MLAWLAHLAYLPMIYTLTLYSLIHTMQLIASILESCSHQKVTTFIVCHSGTHKFATYQV